MAWSTTDIATNDIIQQDGVFAYSFQASGTIYKGQAVCIPKVDNNVMATTAAADGANAIGFATQDATNDNYVPVAGPGNIVVCCMDDASSTPGTILYGDTDGRLDATAGNATKVAAILVDNAPTQVSGTAAATYHVITALVV